jgi:hypothetical protein
MTMTKHAICGSRASPIKATIPSTNPKTLLAAKQHHPDKNMSNAKYAEAKMK